MKRYRACALGAAAVAAALTTVPILGLTATTSAVWTAQHEITGQAINVSFPAQFTANLVYPGWTTVSNNVYEARVVVTAASAGWLRLVPTSSHVTVLDVEGGTAYGAGYNIGTDPVTVVLRTNNNGANSLSDLLVYLHEPNAGVQRFDPIEILLRPAGTDPYLERLQAVLAHGWREEAGAYYARIAVTPPADGYLRLSGTGPLTVQVLDADGVAITRAGQFYAVDGPVTIVLRTANSNQADTRPVTVDFYLSTSDRDPTDHRTVTVTALGAAMAPLLGMLDAPGPALEAETGAATESVPDVPATVEPAAPDIPAYSGASDPATQVPLDLPQPGVDYVPLPPETEQDLTSQLAEKAEREAAEQAAAEREAEQAAADAAAKEQAAREAEEQEAAEQAALEAAEREAAETAGQVTL